jgi:non-specific protein-tyrosine kinase
MADLIEELERRFDLVIVDTPPVLPVSDALLVGVNVGGVVLVARMVETRRASVKRAVEAVRKVNAVLLGTVSNAVVRHEERTYGSGYGYGYGKGDSSGGGTVAPAAVRPAARRAEAGGGGERRRGRRAAGEPVATLHGVDGAIERRTVELPVDSSGWADTAVTPTAQRAGAEAVPQQPTGPRPAPGVNGVVHFRANGHAETGDGQRSPGFDDVFRGRDR